MTKKETKAAEARVSKAYYATCSGIQIDIMDIPKVFDVGMKAIEDGADEGSLERMISDFVETIRKN